jgi:hypothetical protein
VRTVFVDDFTSQTWRCDCSGGHHRAAAELSSSLFKLFCSRQRNPAQSRRFSDSQHTNRLKQRSQTQSGTVAVFSVKGFAKSDSLFVFLCFDVCFQECEATVSQHISNVNKSLPSSSRIQAFKVLGREFSVKEGEITSHALIVPKVIEAKYKHIIEQL